MFTLSKRRKRFIAGLGTAAAVGLVFCLVSHFDLLHQTRLQSSDFFFKAADAGPAAEGNYPIAIVAIDDKTLEKMGRLSSWPRSYHARLIDNLAADGARVIVFDVLFAEPAPGDAEMAAAMDKTGNVILASAGTFESLPGSGPGDAGTWTVIRPLGQLAEKAKTVGNAGVAPDDDGVVRRLPMVVADGGVDEPSLSLAAVAGYLRRPQAIGAIESGHLYLAGRSVPLDRSDNMLVNFAGSSFSSPDFEKVSYVDVLENNFTAGAFKDKIAVIGATAVGMGDTFWTPMGRMVSGVELHANAMNTILTGNFLAGMPSLFTYLSILLLSLLGGLAVLRLGTLRAVAAAVVLEVIYSLAAFFGFDRGILPDMLDPPLALAAAFVGVSLYNVTLERLEKKEIASTFGRYVSPAVASKILKDADADALVPGGEESVATILFADARNFTRLSETIHPQELAALLNRYFPVIISTVIRHGGMVNKFQGDSIMAIWNVPAPCQEHALMATTAAFEAQQAIRELQEKHADLPSMEFGMGVNTGPVMAGNMGSADRLEYSVVGDAVNVAARLTGAAPGGKVWVGPATFEQVEGRVEARALGPQTVKGKLEPVPAWEITGIKSRPSETRPAPALSRRG
jgi:adenylate cyclase